MIDEWFTGISSIHRYKRMAKIKSFDSKKWTAFSDHIASLLMSEKQNIHHGSDCGNRTTRLKNVVQSIHYWIQHIVFTHDDRLQMNMFRSGTDVYGNYFTNYTIDFKDYKWAYNEKETLVNGRIIVQVEPYLSAELVVSDFKRKVVSKFPKLFNPLKDKFRSSFTVVMRIWFDPIHYINIDVYKYVVSNRIVIRNVDPYHNKDHDYELRKLLFGSRKSLSGL